MPELDDEQSRAVVHTLSRCTMFESAAPIRVWRELLNERWVIFLSYGEQTYCLLPLLYTGYAGTDDAPRVDDA